MRLSGRSFSDPPNKTRLLATEEECWFGLKKYRGNLYLGRVRHASRTLASMKSFVANCSIFCSGSWEEENGRAGGLEPLCENKAIRE